MTILDISFSLPDLFNYGGIEINPVTVICFILVFTALVFLITYIVSKTKKEKFTITSRELATGSITIAMSFVLSLIGFSLPFGGTVTFCSLLPISLFAHYKGFSKSLPFVIVYMILQLINHPYIVSIWSMLLDYIIPYFSISLIGLTAYKGKDGSFKEHLPYYILFAVYLTIRYASHVLSGILFWDYSADYGMTSFAYSAAYNSFALIDGAITLAASVPFLMSRQINKVLHSS